MHLIQDTTSSSLTALKDELHAKIGEDISANEAMLKQHVAVATAESKDEFDEKFENISVSEQTNTQTNKQKTNTASTASLSVARRSPTVQQSTACLNMF